MVNIKSNLSISSTTFFPNNGRMSTSITETFTGESDFQSIVIPAGGVGTIFGPTAPGAVVSTVFLYVEAADTNAGGFTVRLAKGVEAPLILATLLPKDFLCLPLSVNGDSITVTAVNLNGAASGKLNIFWGVR
jgi:hypothetical protein